MLASNMIRVALADTDSDMFAVLATNMSWPITQQDLEKHIAILRELRPTNTKAAKAAKTSTHLTNLLHHLPFVHALLHLMQFVKPNGLNRLLENIYNLRRGGMNVSCFFFQAALLEQSGLMCLPHSSRCHCSASFR
jgi:hypothetical protein